MLGQFNGKVGQSMSDQSQFNSEWGTDEEIVARFHTESWYAGGAADAFEQCEYMDANEWPYSEDERQGWLRIRGLVIAKYGDEYPVEKEYPYRDDPEYDGRYERGGKPDNIKR